MNDKLQRLLDEAGIKQPKKKGTRFVKIEKEKRCLDPEHDPPKFIVIPQGHAMVHTCPTCGREVTVYPEQYSLSV